LSHARRQRTGAVALVIATLLALATVGTALAHANLVRSDPASGASLTTAPSRIQLWFSEDLEPSFSTAQVLDSKLQPVDLGDSHVAPNDPLSLIVSVKPGLVPGIYVVAWKTQSKLDGHIVRGTVPFGVGTSVVPSAATASVSQGAVSGTPLEMVLRWLILLAGTMLVGSFSFWILQEKPLAERAAAKSLDLGGLPRGLPGQTAIAWIALAIFLAGNFGLLILQTATAADVTALAAIGAPIGRVLVSTQFGNVWLARVVLVLLIGLLLIVRGRADDRAAVLQRVGLVAGLALLGTMTLTSHGASYNLATPVGILPAGVAVDWLHLIGVALWVGGLAQLAIVLARSSNLGGAAERARFFSTLVPRFSALAGGATALIAATGLAQGLIDVGTLDNLLGTGYGQALGTKLILGVPLAAIAIVNHYVIRPALAQVRQNGAASTLRCAIESAALLRTTVRFELILVASIIGAVGIMTSLSPAQQIGASASAGPLSLQGTAGTLPLGFSLGPGRPGPNHYVVDLRPAGSAAANVEGVALRFTFLDSNLGVSEVVLKSTRPEVFEGDSTDLVVAGRWQTEVLVRPTGQGDLSASFTYEVTPEGARVGASPTLQLSWLFYAAVALVLIGLGALGRGIWLRQWDLRRASVVAACGIGLIGTGGYLGGQDVVRAQASAAALVMAQSHPVTPQSVADGAVVYRQNCVVCHGLDARGDGPMAPTLNPRPADLILHVPLHPDGDLYGWISDGFPGSAMPAFRSQLTDQQRWDVLNYLKSLTSATTATAAIAAPTPIPSVPPTVVSADQSSGLATNAPLQPVDEPTTSPTWAALTPTAEPLDDTNSIKTIGDLRATLKVTPRVFQPAEFEINLTGPNGQPATGIQRVDLQTAMVGMDHGARGIAAREVGPGRYSVSAMMFAMPGPWRVAIRVERGGVVGSTVFRVDVPRDDTTGVVSAMAERLPGPIQVEDVAIYPGEVSPPYVAVVAGRPVRLEIMFVDHPTCASAVRLDAPSTEVPVTSDGLAEVYFVPARSGKLQLSCDAAYLRVHPVGATG
jgi:copper transport protein